MSRICKIAYSGNIAHGNSCSNCRKRPLLNRISSMTDDEIIKASVRKAEEDVEKSSAARVLRKGPLMFLAATTMVYGALAKGKLSDKAIEAAKAAGIAGVVYGLSKPVDRINNKIFEDDKENQHGILKAATGIIGLLGASALVLKGAKAGGSKMASLFRPTADTLKRYVDKGAEWLNSTKLGIKTDKITESLSSFAAKHEKLANVLKTSAIVAPLIGTLGVSYAMDKKNKEDKFHSALSNMNKLTLCREMAKSSLESKDKE